MANLDSVTCFAVDVYACVMADLTWLDLATWVSIVVVEFDYCYLECDCYLLPK